MKAIISALLSLSILASCTASKKIKTQSNSESDSLAMIKKQEKEDKKTDSLVREIIKKKDSSVTKTEEETETTYEPFIVDSGDVVSTEDDYFPVITKPDGRKIIFLKKQKQTKKEIKNSVSDSESEKETKLQKTEAREVISSSKTEVKKKASEKSKDVKRGLPIQIYFVFGGLVLLLLIAYKFRKKITSFLKF